MKVNPVKLVPLDQLHVNPDNPKKPLGARYSRGLKESLERYGFSSVFNVAPNADGSYELLDGNSRQQLLDAGGVDQVPCVIHEDMGEGQPDWKEKRTEFTLSFDRNRKVFDEDAVVRQLKDLVGKGRDLTALSKLIATDNLRQLVSEQSRSTAGKTATTTQAKIPTQGSLVLYGAAEDVEAVKQLCKRLRGRMGPLVKVRQALEQADQFQDLTDEGFLLALLSAIQRTAEV